MASLPEDITFDIEKLEKFCDAMENNERRNDTPLSRARIAEIKQLRAQLKMMPNNFLEVFSLSEIRGAMKRIRDRARNLRFKPESAGEHNFMMEKDKE